MRPVPASVPVTLGYRQRMASRPKYIHRGIDFGCPPGTPVSATVRGRVVHAGRGGMGPAFGIHVVLLTDGIYHIYAHLSSESVSVGDWIDAGQQLGHSGATGNVTGPHTHYGEFTSYNYLADRRPLFIDRAKPSSKPPASAGTLLVMSRNLAAEAKAWQRSTFAERLDYIVKDVEDTDPDVFLVQEAGGASYVAELDKRLERIGYRRAPGGGRWRYVYTRTATVEVLRSGLITLNATGTKHAAWAEVRDRKKHRRLIVTSAHLSEGWASTDKVRLAQAKVLVDKVAKLNPNGYPVVHAGDFNSYRLVTDYLLKRRFKDALDIADERHHTSDDTFNGRTSTAVPRSTPKRGQHLDHITVSAGVYVSRWTQHVQPEGSDHNGIAARLYF